jgi:hypothetical protein
MLKPLPIGPHTLEYPGCDIIHINVVESTASASEPLEPALAPTLTPQAEGPSWGRVKVMYR